MATDLEFVTTSVAARTQKNLTANNVLAAGDKLKMELGDKELDAVVPDGKVWHARIQVFVDETDA